MMELGRKSLKSDTVKGKETVEIDFDLEREWKDCRNRCVELENTGKKVNERCLMLELEVEKKNNEIEFLKGKFKELESRVLELEESLPEMGMKEMNESRVSKHGLDVATSSTHLLTLNKMMDSDKMIHDSHTEIGDLQLPGVPPSDTSYKQSTHVAGGKRCILSGTELEYVGRVGKQSAFGERGSPNKKMAPSMTGGATPASICVVDISDSDGEPDSTMLHMPTPEIQGTKMVSVSTGCASVGISSKIESAFSNNLKRTLVNQSDEDDMVCYGGISPFISSHKRKRASKVVTSDSECDDDNVPISKRKIKNLEELYTDSNLNSCSLTATVSAGKVTESVPRRRLVTMRKCEVKNRPERSYHSPSNLKRTETNCYPGIPTNENVENDKMEEDGPNCEGECFGGFIVDRSRVSNNNDASSESEDASDGNIDFDEIMSIIQRSRDHNLKWEFEADMLAAFGKDPELCMKAVCALYRQQKSGEKSSKETIYSGQRGFSHCDALRGTTLGEFLTAGDPKADLKKSVEELQEYNPRGLELCKTLATHHSKQLYAIYKNKEDPLFLHL